MSSNKIKAAVIAMAILAGAASATMYHEQSSATSTITYSGRSLTVNGKPTWILSGDVEYWRLPRELWRDRLTRVKRAGYNSVTSYIAWNLHEPVQGQFHFEDNLNLDAWLSLIDSLGMYAIVRAGPYICAEVDFGGFPPWLADIPNIKIRGTDAQYLAAVDAFYGQIMPIIAKHQVTNGGAVVVVQIENEYYPAGGAYQSHLVSKAQSLGIVVPYIWSNIYNGTTYDPGAFPDFSSKGLMTEQWTGWISRYGPSAASDVITYNDQTWRMLGCGSGGTSHYMAIGGTDFGYTSSPDQRITSYDYGAPIGELGQIRPALYSVKQTGYLANAFNGIFATSTDGSSGVSGLPGTLASYTQTSSAGKAAMVSGGSATFTVDWKNKGVTVPTTGSWSLQDGNSAHFIADAPITSNATLDYSATGILGQKKLGTKNYLVLYSTPGNTGGDIAFVYKTAPATAPGAPWSWNATAKRASMRFTYPTTDSVNEVDLDDGAGQTINLLIMNTNQSNKTWFTDSSIVTGADYVDENENLQFPAAGGKAYVYSKTATQTVSQGATTGPSAKSFASGWSWISSPEVGASYNDAAWTQSATAQDMVSYGWPNGYGWYRTTYTAASAGTATLAIPKLQGSAFIFVNGTYAGTSTSQSITLKQGANSIAILVSAAERDKQYNTLDFTPPDIVKSGILAGVTIGGASTGPWRFRGGFEGVDESPMMGTITPASWTASQAKTWSTGTAPLDNVPRLWRMDFPYTPPANALQTWTLSGTVTSGTQGVVWFNGHCLGRQITSQPALFVPEAWLQPTNTIILVTQGGGAPQGYSLSPVEYHSLVKSPVGTTALKTEAPTSLVARANAATTILSTGNGLSLPSGFTGKDGSIAIYDLQGHLVVGNVRIHNGQALLPVGKPIPRGVLIARSEN
jgi:beta-galactosidase